LLPGVFHVELVELDDRRRVLLGRFLPGLFNGLPPAPCRLDAGSDGHQADLVVIDGLDGGATGLAALSATLLASGLAS
jgi:hypothetical protein